jgi:hypothetical protein
MRTLWRDDVASFDGRFVGFDSIRVNPKLIRDRGIPIVMGGNSDPALRRVASLRTAGTGSTWTASPRCVSDSASWMNCAPGWVVTVVSCGWPWHYGNQGLRILMSSPRWVLTNWCLWKCRLSARRPRATGFRRWQTGGYQNAARAGLTGSRLPG